MEKLLQFVSNGQLKLLMEFILYEWVTVNSEIIIAVFWKLVISGDPDLNGKPVVSIWILSGPHDAAGAYSVQCYPLSYAGGKSCFFSFAWLGAWSLVTLQITLLDILLSCLFPVFLHFSTPHWWPGGYSWPGHTHPFSCLLFVLITSPYFSCLICTSAISGHELLLNLFTHCSFSLNLLQELYFCNCFFFPHKSTTLWFSQSK